MPEEFLPPHGGYKNLLSYQKAKIVFEATAYWCDRFLEPRDRTKQQMIQAARSGKQNIIEGSMASGTSKESELHLTNVAKASLEELLEDYRDFMNLRGYAEWDKNHPYAKRLRELNKIKNATYDTFRAGIENKDPVISTNVIIGLILVTTYLLTRQISRLQTDFATDGGVRERMTRARLKARRRNAEPKDG